MSILVACTVQWIRLSVLAALFSLGVVGAWYLWTSWHSLRRTARIINRIAPALVELDEFYKLIDLSVEKSHFFERHGPWLKTHEVFARSKTGNIEFSGLYGKPVTSTRWYRHADLLKAIQEALSRWSDGERPKNGAFVFRFNVEIGEGYEKGSTRLAKTSIAVVVVKNGAVITAYPLLRISRRDDLE